MAGHGHLPALQQRFTGAVGDGDRPGWDVSRRTLQQLLEGPRPPGGRVVEGAEGRVGVAERRFSWSISAATPAMVGAEKLVPLMNRYWNGAAWALSGVALLAQVRTLVELITWPSLYSWAHG
jgi:hypothetical protein